MASSSQRTSAYLPSADPQLKHDVFLSFRGADTRKGITSYLYDELQKSGIKTFKDDQVLEVGEAISPSLLKAIKESRFAIIILSPNYASSMWCLDELFNIVQSMEDERRILPLFYHVEPSDVRYQKKSFEVAFSKHVQKYRQDGEKVDQWRFALRKVANLSGWDIKNFQSERELVKHIVECVCTKVRPINMEPLISAGDFEALEATTRSMDQLMKALENDEVVAIGVYGMGGVGKTTLVKHVGAQAQKLGLFNYVIMAVVSQSPVLRKIQGAFADLLGLRLEAETEIGRAIQLKQMIMKRDRILIILDDIWKTIDLSTIGVPSSDELRKCNSKILLTTRRLNVCYSMESQRIIPLKTLTEEDSWKLFAKKARKSFEKPTSFYNVARKVAKECAGLPIALVAVARALADKEYDEWCKAAERLMASQPVNSEDEGDVFKCIKLSYDYLRSDDSKWCFLLCCLFPEDHHIEIEDLLMYGIGKGLFQNSDTLQEARAAAHSEVKYLQASSLLLGTNHEGRVRVTMHDVVRDVAILISFSEEGQRFLVKASCGLQNWPNFNARKGYSAISLMDNDIHKLPEELVCSNLQILLLQRNADITKIPETFFQCMKELRVLDLRMTSISLLPPSFCFLNNVHTLRLDGCILINDISIIGNLKKLEILSMRECRFKELPQEIGHLTNLRMLDVTGGRVDTIPAKVISRLYRLEELYLQCNIWEWGSGVEREGEKVNMVGFDEVTGLLYLNILKVYISNAGCLPKFVGFNPDWVYFDICISIEPVTRYLHFEDEQLHLIQAYSADEHRLIRDYSRILSLGVAINAFPDWFINCVTKRAEKLIYIGCKGLNNILVEFDQGRLQALKYLTVFWWNDENFQELMNTTTRVSNTPVFENLEELQLINVYCLKELCVGELPLGSLCNLKLLVVRNCHKLQNALVQSNLLQRLHNLEKISCSGLEGIEYLFGCEDLEQQQILTPHTVFHTLKVLTIFNCCKLRNLITSDLAKCLWHLEKVRVDTCPSLNTVIEASKETMKDRIVFPKLKTLCLRSLPQLTSFCSVTLEIECPSLEKLDVSDCLQFSTSMSDFHSQKHVQVTSQKYF